MEINSRIFGKIEIDDNKIITIPNGLLGFEKYTRYVIAYDSDKESKNGIMWLQCVDEPELAFPVMDPMFIIKDYVTKQSTLSKRRSQSSLLPQSLFGFLLTSALTGRSLPTKQSTKVFWRKWQCLFNLCSLPSDSVANLGNTVGYSSWLRLPDLSPRKTLSQRLQRLQPAFLQ